MHREYEDLLLLYTTHSLDQVGRQQLEEHLQTCETCRASLKEWRALSLAVCRAANQRADSLPALRLPDLEQENNAMQSTHVLPQRYYYVPVTFAAIAAMLIFTAVVLFMRTPGSTLTVFVQPTIADTVEIVMPTHLLRIDRRIVEGDVALVSIPVEVAPTNGLTSLEEVIGKFARTDIYCGQPILSNMVADHSPYVPEYHNYAEIDRNEVCNLAPNPDDELVNVVIASREIHQGETISEVIVELRPYPSPLIPRDAFVNIEDVTDRVAITDIFPGQLIIEQITVELTPLDIPEGTVMTYALIDDIENISFDVQEGDRVNLSMTLFFINDVDGWRLVTAETPQARSITIPIARNAYLVQIGASENAETGDDHRDRIYVAVSLDEALILSSLVEAQIGITMTLMPESANVDRPLAETTPQIVPESRLEVPDGMVAVYISLDRATLVFAQENVIDIYAPEVGELLVRTPVAPVLAADGSYLAPSPMVQVANDAQIIPTSGSRTMLPVAVSPEEAELLRRLIENDFPLTLVDAGLIEQTLASTPATSREIPEGMVAVSVPRTQILAVPHDLHPDHVDIVITLRFADIDDQFQVLVPTGTPPDTRSVTQVSISNALQIPSDDPDMMTFVLSPEDAVVLTWLVEARIPLILVSPGSWPGEPVMIPTNP